MDTGSVTNGTVTRVCVMCGRSFRGMNNEKYCSEKCRKRAHEIQKRAYYERELMEDAEVVKCPVCGKEFRRGIKRRIYCSDRCRKAAGDSRDRVEKRVEENAREWKERGYDVSGIKDAISQTNEVARMQHKSYGEIQTERLIERIRKERGDDL